MRERKNAAVIGCGMISRNHLKALKNIDHAEIYAVCDIQKEKAEKAGKEYGARKIYEDYKKLISDPGVDVIHICTPHNLHGSMAEEALAAGKHVLCEKPMALTVTEARAMLAARESSGVQLGICFQNRYNEASVCLKQVMESGKLGTLLGARAQVTWNRNPDYYENSPWRGKWESEGGGVLINQAIHTLDLLQWLTCGIKKAEAGISTRRLKTVIEVEDTADILMTGEHGERLLFYATNCYVKNAPVELEIICSRGSLKLVGNQVVTESDGRVEKEDYTSGTVLGKDYWGSGHGELIRDFYDCIETGRPFPVSGEEALKMVKLLEAVYRSGKTGTAVEVSDGKE
nr:Gfo/Idh/MocA family oxidoreductase [uncultured Clostridium sp.]